MRFPFPTAARTSTRANGVKIFRHQKDRKGQETEKPEGSSRTNHDQDSMFILFTPLFEGRNALLHRRHSRSCFLRIRYILAHFVVLPCIALFACISPFILARLATVKYQQYQESWNSDRMCNDVVSTDRGECFSMVPIDILLKNK